MFLSIIPRLERDPYKAHVFLYSYFPGVDEGDPRPFVYRETEDYLIVISRIRPNCNCVEIKPRINAGSTIGFSLLCSPQRGRSFRRDGVRITAARVSYDTHEEVSQWLARRLDGSAKILYQNTTTLPNAEFKSKSKRFELPARLIKGSLQITDKSNFIESVVSGIGPKGFAGFGLLLMPEIMKDAMELANAAA